jgi:glycosyltransferase involved in cell wall biosynthesis
LIIIDGNSQDNTLEIINSNKNINKNIILKWISENDDGIYDAWNKGIAIANGDWIAFLGAGDCYLPDALSCYYDKIQSDGYKIEFISSKIQLIDEGGRILREIGRPFNFAQHKKFMCIGHVGALHKKTLFNKHGKFDVAYTSAGDYEYLMRCGETIKSSFIETVTATMLVGGVSNTYNSILETHKIQLKYGISLHVIFCRASLAIIKRILRKNIRGY